MLERFLATTYGLMCAACLSQDSSVTKIGLSGDPSEELTPSPRSSLVLIGGGDYHDQNERILKKIISLARTARPGSPPRFGIITAAAGRHDALLESAGYISMFGDLGAEAKWLPVDAAHPEWRLSTAFLAEIEAMNGFFFSGGDQDLILLSLHGKIGPSPVLKAMHRAFAKGAVIAGTSAGTVAQVARQTPLILGGSNWSAVNGDGANIHEYRDMAQWGDSKFLYDSNGGLGFFPFGLLESHFSERQRELRLMVLAATAGETRRDLAFGIDEGTALIATDLSSREAQFTVMGDGGVFVADPSASRTTWHPCLQIKNMRAAYLTEGDRYYFFPRKVVMAGDKLFLARDKPTPRSILRTPIPMVNAADGFLEGTEESDDATSRGFANLAAASLLSGMGQAVQTTAGTHPNFRLRLNPSWAVAAVPIAQVTGGGDGGPLVSYDGMRIDLECSP